MPSSSTIPVNMLLLGVRSGAASPCGRRRAIVSPRDRSIRTSSSRPGSTCASSRRPTAVGDRAHVEVRRRPAGPTPSSFGARYQITRSTSRSRRNAAASVGPRLQQDVADLAASQQRRAPRPETRCGRPAAGRVPSRSRAPAGRLRRAHHDPQRLTQPARAVRVAGGQLRIVGQRGAGPDQHRVRPGRAGSWTWARAAGPVIQRLAAVGRGDPPVEGAWRPSR